MNLHRPKEPKGVQHGLLQFGHGVVEAARHEEAFEPPPHPFYEIEVRTIRGQIEKRQSRALSHSGCFPFTIFAVWKGALSKTMTTSFFRLRASRASASRKAETASLRHEPSKTEYSSHSSSPFERERADEVHAPLRTPAGRNPMLMALALPRPRRRRGQAQREAALIEVFQDDLPLCRPF